MDEINASAAAYTQKQAIANLAFMELSVTDLKQKMM